MRWYTLAEVQRLTGVPRSHLSNLVLYNRVPSEDDKLSEDIVRQMQKERETYISIAEYALAHASEKFKGSSKTDRNKLLDYLEQHQFFGVGSVPAGSLLIGTSKDLVFFERTGIEILDDNLHAFFGDFGLSAEDKIARILKADKTHPETREMLREYHDEMMFETRVTPIHAEFVQILMKMPDLLKITDDDIAKAMKSIEANGAKDVFISFLSFAKQFKRVKYSKLMRQRKKPTPIGAYSDDTYLIIAACIFNSEYIEEHDMIQKALDNHTYAEMWLYLALHYACGWRAEDICKRWQYPDLASRKDSLFGINKDTLYEDILEDRIPDEVYEQVCSFCIESIQLSQKLPGKTSVHDPLPLMVMISPTLHTFYGMLTLIGEAHHLKTGEGFMKQGRARDYQKRMNIKRFFGQELYNALDGNNILSISLNKDYLQGIDLKAKESGAGAVLSSAIASYARNHTNLNTISHYLKDHKLTGETAEMVLYFMLERGVFGFEVYQTLLTAYPEAMRALPVKKQNEVLSLIEKAPYDIEMAATGNQARYQMKDHFLHGDKDSVLQLLTSMFEITQNRGQAKDEGVYCIARAYKYVCQNKGFKSCLANACPYLIFTRYGFVPLIEVIRDYSEAAKNGNIKAGFVLKNAILPRYREILNEFMASAGMNQDDRAGLKKIMEDTLHE